MGLGLFKRRPLPPPSTADCDPVLESSSTGALVPEAYARGPAASRWVAAALRPVEALFDRLFGPALNPVYRSGTLAFLFLLLATASGLYLLFFYRLSDPYGSVARLQADPWAGRWLRAWHRYCADAAVLATAVHLLRMLAEGKTWGPRALAWVSGVLLAGMLGLCAWTGYVMVWDGQALALARAGARAADLLPIFAEPLSRGFHGALQPPPSFFFMNLFLHVAIPLGLVFVLWAHTAHLSKSAWFPERRGLWLWGGALLLLSIAMPLGLDDKADPLALGAAFEVDPFFNGWLTASLALAPGWTLLLAPLGTALLALLPWLWRPAPALRPQPSHNDEVRCQGCVTCAHDCPFEAISMVPRTAGIGSTLVARVDPSLCVSCGLCVASCDRLSIGPYDRIGTRQLAQAQALGREVRGEAIVLIHCASGGLGEALRERADVAGLLVLPWALDCLGDLHPFTVRALQQRFRGVLLASCAPAACQMRHGADLARLRFVEKQEPADKAGLDDARLRLVQRPPAELDAAWAELRAFAESLGMLAPTAAPAAAPPRPRWLRASLDLARMLPFAAILAWLAALQTGRAETTGSALRLAWRLPGQALRDCRDLSAAELAARPAHMRRKTECVTRRLSYRLTLHVDGAPVLERHVAPRGAHGDSPLNVDLDLPLEPGSHTIDLRFEPAEEDRGLGRRLRFAAPLKFAAGRIVLLTLDRDGSTLESLGNQP